LTQLKGKKLRFYLGEESLREDDLKAEEQQIFRDILEHKIKASQERVKLLHRKIAQNVEQGELPGLGTGKGKQLRLQFEEQWRAERQLEENRLQQLQQAREKVTDRRAIPFVWDIAFVEIFEGEKEGFDIVIGNPPYIRQEEIKALKPVLQAQGYTCYTGTADLYVYFYERALQLLRDGGVLAFISSNKYFRAAYGEKLRALLARQTIHRIIDFGDAPV
ncbi:MAG: Eco57I restriction-modification methylase domain-containing protein, partial [Verrucomicrobiota bacterium]|nr:Eco57I restriction-modification methylase domain-containing protein [Verrucomicrobiota bacterium]